MNKVTEIKYKRKTTALGRNGFIICSGVEVAQYSERGVLTLTAFNSRGETSRCEIWVPVESAGDLADALRNLSKGVKSHE